VCEKKSNRERERERKRECVCAVNNNIALITTIMHAPAEKFSKLTYHLGSIIMVKRTFFIAEYRYKGVNQVPLKL